MILNNSIEINRYILAFLDFNTITTLAKCSKTIPNEIIQEYIRKRYSGYIIKDFYRRNSIDDNSNSMEFNANSNNFINKYNLVRLYIAKYPMEYLQNYPDFMIQKCRSRFGLQKYNLLKSYIDSNLNINSQVRTRRDIRSFLLLDQITKDDILYTGW